MTAYCKISYGKPISFCFLFLFLIHVDRQTVIYCNIMYNYYLFNKKKKKKNTHTHTRYCKKKKKYNDKVNLFKGKRKGIQPQRFKKKIYIYNHIAQSITMD